MSGAGGGEEEGDQSSLLTNWANTMIGQHHQPASLDTKMLHTQESSAEMVVVVVALVVVATINSLPLLVVVTRR